MDRPVVKHNQLSGGPPPLFRPDVWRRFRRRFLSGPLLLSLDYDGTLAPIVSTPEKARLASPLRRQLARLARRPGLRLACVSGRSLADLRRLLRLPSLIKIGSHGFEIEEGRRRWVHPATERFRRDFRAGRPSLARLVRRFPGAWVQDKTCAASVHFRALPARRAAEFQKAFAAWRKTRGRRFAALPGKRVVDLLPRADWDKGRALLRVRRRVLPGGPLVHVGDDTTDERAFRTLGRGGFGVWVGAPRNNHAKARLGGSGGVRRLLSLLETHDDGSNGRRPK